MRGPHVVSPAFGPIQTAVQLAQAALTRSAQATAIVIRHAKRPAFARDMSPALMDAISITEDGHAAAQALGLALMPLRRIVYTSPIIRCVQTAEALGANRPKELSLLATVDTLVPQLIQEHFDQRVERDRAETQARGEQWAGGLWVYVSHDTVISLIVDAAMGRVPDTSNCYPIPFLGGVLLRPTA